MASAGWERRNARARALGYESYYDYRAHDNGRLPPSAPRLRGGPLRRSRGHASLADLEALVERRGAELVVIPVGLERDAKGCWGKIDVLVLLPDGSERHFVLRGKQAAVARLERLRDKLEAAGVRWLAAPSLDVFAGGMEATA